MSQLGSKLSGEAITSKALKKINTKLKFLYRQSRYLTPAYKRLLCNALIQPHFNYRCSSWFSLLKKSLKLKLQATQNKCIRFCLQLLSRSHIDRLHFRKINWLPASGRVECCIVNAISKYWNGTVPVWPLISTPRKKVLPSNYLLGSIYFPSTYLLVNNYSLR